MKVKTQKILTVAGLLLFVLAAIILTAVFKDELYLLIKEPEVFREWVSDKGFLAQVIYVLAVIFQVIVAFIPGEPFEVAAGYAFGAVEGTILSLIATTIGSILVFLLVRTYGMKLVKLFFSEEKIKALSFLKISKKKLIVYFIILLIPGTPKDLLCYFAGLTDMKLSIWIYISFFARIPSVVTSTIGGNLLGKENYITALAVFLITFVICIGGIIVYYKITDGNKGR